MKPGFAFGGSCLPKDLRALTYVGKQNDVTTPMLGNVMGSNRAHIDHALDLVTQSGKRKIGMIGLSFKPGTDDLRESPLVTVAERLIGKGYDLRIYDPEVNLSRLLGANKRYIEHSIPHIGSLMSDDCAAVIDHAEVLIVGLAGRESGAGDCERMRARTKWSWTSSVCRAERECGRIPRRLLVGTSRMEGETVSEVVRTTPRMDARQSALAVLLLAAFVLVASAYFPTFASIVEKWDSDATFSHGFLIVPVSLWLAWRVRAELAASRFRPVGVRVRRLCFCARWPGS